MPTPRIYTGFKPAVQGYSIGSPDGVRMTDVGGGLPRIGLEWDRGRQAIPLTRVMPADEFSVWTVWFHRVIKKGSIQFTMPLNTGMGLVDHLCLMVPGSYSATPAGSGKNWVVSFTVLAENEAYDMSEEDVTQTMALWELYGGGSDELLARLAQFATVDTLVLVP